MFAKIFGFRRPQPFISAAMKKRRRSSTVGTGSSSDDDVWDIAALQQKLAQGATVESLLYGGADPAHSVLSAQKAERVVGLAGYDVEDTARAMEREGWSFVGVRKHGDFMQIVSFERNASHLSVVSGTSEAERENRILEMMQRGYMLLRSVKVNAYLYKLTFRRVNP